MNNAARIVALCFSGLMFAGCGGGGKSSQNTDITFSVSLENVDIRRVSNGETVDIDTTGISSERMILNKE
jgi:hypothetical protein